MAPPPPLRLRLLGGFAAERPGTAPSAGRWRRPSAKTLVKLLAVAPGHRLHRDQVMDVCWPESDAESAVRSLRVALHAARHTLEPELPARAPSSYLLGEGGLLLLHPELVEVDLDHVMALADLALADGGLAALEEAHGELAAELLPEDRYAEWATPSREALDVLGRRVVLALAAAAVAEGTAERAVEVLGPVLDRDPAAEDAHRAMIEAYLALGRRRNAVVQYHRCRDALAAELGARPAKETERLYRRALAERVVVTAAGDGAAPLLPAQARRPSRHDLVGREHAAELVGPGRSAAAPLVLISGEAGVGKTRLVTEAARRHAACGALVLWGAGHEAEGHTPYGAWVEALDGYLADRPAAERAAIGSQYPELATLLPSLGLIPPGDGDHERERARIFSAVAALLTDLSARPLLVVLDDLHAADTGSAQLLYHLARSTGERPWRFLATWREEDLPVDDGRRHTLEAVLRHGLAQRLELMRLGRADCDRLLTKAVGRPLTPAELDWAYGLSLGNPLFAIELAGAYLHDPAVVTSGVGEAGVPVAVRHLVGGRLARMNTPARRMVEVLAVAGGDAPLAEVFEVAASGLYPPMSRPEVAAALAEALETGIVEEREVLLDGRHVPGHGFRHPLVRLACAERLSGVVRTGLHAAYADAVLSHRPEAVDAVVYHLTRAGDPRAVPYLWRAAKRAASLYANESAAGYLERLVGLLDAAGAAAAADARLAWGEALRRTGRYDAAERELSAALATFRGMDATCVRAELEGTGSEPPADRVSATVTLLAEVLVGAGQPAKARGLLATAPPAEPSVTAATRAARHLAESLTCFATGRYDESLAAVTAAMDLAVEAGPPHGRRLLVRALVSRSVSLAMLGRLPAAEEAAGQALQPAEATGDAALTGTVVAQLGELAGLDGRLGEARQYARRALELAARVGDPAVVAFRTGNLGRLHLLVGDWAAGLRLTRSAVSLARPLGPSWCLPYTLVNLGASRLWTGDGKGAAACLAESVELAEATGDRQVLADARTMLAEIAIGAGRPEEALIGEVEPAVKARALLATGDAEGAAKAAEAAGPKANGLAGIEASLVLGMALTTMGRGGAAVAVLTESVERAEAMPYPYGLARLLEARAAAAGGAVAQRDLARAAHLREGLAAAAREAGNAPVTTAV
ncbi:ATP-binding protein [Nonomuraea sp. CA-141351]|uniref:ATP-binding protein n=1 Tax=Nonomuraea sp. CA-141351 TaxID=3239996 RepID=UPI003D8BC852